LITKPYIVVNSSEHVTQISGTTSALKIQYCHRHRLEQRCFGADETTADLFTCANVVVTTKR